MLRPPNDLAKLNAALGTVLNLTMFNMGPEQVTDWLKSAVSTLAKDPAEALVEGIEQAKRTVRNSNHIVPFLAEYSDNFRKPIERHLAVLRQLVD